MAGIVLGLLLCLGAGAFWQMYLKKKEEAEKSKATDVNGAILPATGSKNNPVRQDSHTSSSSKTD